MRPDPKIIRKKLYTCKVCKNKYEKGVTPSLDFIGVCNFDCATTLAKSKLEQKREAEVKSERHAWKERKIKLKQELGGGKQTEHPLQKEVNKLIRLLDSEYPCLARPDEKHQHYDAGHIYGVGSYPALRYYLWNIHKQSVKSNQHLGGESVLMLQGLEQRYGEDIKEKLENMRRDFKVLKLSYEEEGEVIKRVRELIRRIEKGELLTRDFCITYMGIY